MRTWSRCIRAGKQGGGLEPRPNPWLEFLHGMNGWVRGDVGMSMSMEEQGD